MPISTQNINKHKERKMKTKDCLILKYQSHLHDCHQYARSNDVTDRGT